MKIALISSGYYPTPPLSSSILTLIQGYKEFLEKEGHQVDTFNHQDVHQVIDEINNNDYDFVHLHNGGFVLDFSRKLQQKFCFTSHAGYLLKPNQWDDTFKQEFQSYLNIPGIIALSPASKQLFLDAGYDGYMSIQVNGIDTQKINYQQQGNGKAICLGWIQPRKQQRLLAETVDGDLAIDFVGPLDDLNFKEGSTTKYLGVWSSEEVCQRLTEYSCLILISHGEVAPLVVLEAMAAGLSVVVSNSASANLHEKDFIRVLPDNILTDPSIVNQQVVCDVIKETIANNQLLRPEITNYAKENFDFSCIIQNYVDNVDNFINFQSNK
jgi:glycosyltransferase involved in cell wall biosynthesis